MHLDGAGGYFAVVLPDLPQHLVARHNALAVIHQIAQELNFFRRRGYALSVPANIGALEINGYIVELECPCRNSILFANPPQQCLQAREQIGGLAR